MSGPEHYRKAEKLLDNAWTRMAGGSGGLLHTHETRADLIATAHVHATLALAAATIAASAHPNQSQVDYLGSWWEAGA